MDIAKSRNEAVCPQTTRLRNWAKQFKSLEGWDCRFDPTVVGSSMNPRTRELIVGRPRCDGQPWSAHMLQSLMEHLMELTAHYGGDRGRTNRVTLARDLASVLLVLSLDMGQGGTA